MNMRSPRTTIRIATVLAVVIIFLIGSALYCCAEPRAAHRKPTRNAQTLPWLGNPTSRIYYGNRKVDGYRQSNGTVLLYERGHLVGVQ